MSRRVKSQEGPTVDPDIKGDLAKKRVMLPVLSILRVAMIRTRIHYEEGAEEEIYRHRDAGGALLMLQTHFRRWEPIVMARVAASQPSMKHVRFTTGITARSELFDWPFPAGYVVRSSGAQRVKRVLEHPDETAEQRAARKEANLQTQAVGGRLLARGYNWLIYPEGGSMQVVEENGEIIRKPREPGVVMPLYDGFVRSLENMTDEERRRVKMLGIAVHYGEGSMSRFNPTVHIGMPVSPEGTREDWFHQGEEILSHGVSEAVRLHELRTN